MNRFKPGQYVHIFKEGICKILKYVEKDSWKVQWIKCPESCGEPKYHENVIAAKIFIQQEYEIISESEILAYEIIES